MDKMSINKNNMKGDLKRIVEDHKKGNANITEVMKLHKNPI